MKLNWISLLLHLNHLYTVCMFIVYLKNEGNCQLWLIPVRSLFIWAFCNVSNCHFPARWHSRLCVKYDVLSFSMRCKKNPFLYKPCSWTIRSAETAEQTRHQPAWGLVYASAMACPLPLTAGSRHCWPQILQKRKDKTCQPPVFHFSLLPLSHCS